MVGNRGTYVERALETYYYQDTFQTDKGALVIIINYTTASNSFLQTQHHC